MVLSPHSSSAYTSPNGKHVSLASSWTLFHDTITTTTINIPPPDWLQQRRQKRVQATRPSRVLPTTQHNHGLPSLAGIFQNNDIPVIPANNPVITTKGGNTTTTTLTTDWTKLCTQANMNKGSQVVMFNILSHPVGPTLAKVIAKQCQVRNIIGADPMLPNLRQTRMAFMSIREHLHYAIPDLRMVVTEPGKGLYEKNRIQPLQWLRPIQPTHVLILDPMDSPILVESMGGLLPSFELYALQQIRHVWQDITATMSHLPIRVLHVANPLLGEKSSTVGLGAVSLWQRNIPFSFATVSLGPLSGPGIHTDLYPQDFSATTFVEHGLRALLMGWSRPKQFFTVQLQDNIKVTDYEEMVEQAIWKEHVQEPFGMTTTTDTFNQTSVLATRQRLEALGSTPIRLPCASQCQSQSSLRSCTASKWDQVINASISATQNCVYALIMANFSTHLTEAVRHSVDPSLCRVLYISRKSPLAQRQKSDQNGIATSNGWKLVWLDFTEKSFSALDESFLRIDPSRLLSPSVVKVMHVDTTTFGMAPDQALLNIMKTVDRPAFGDGQRRVLEVRRGTELKHWKRLPAEKARRSVLFAGNTLLENRPSKVTDYKTIVRGRVSPKQIEFYNQLGHWTHVVLDRPQSEIEATRYLSFPFEWTSRFFIIHDLVSETARQLRCRWLEEHVLWNTKPSYRNTDDLSLAAVLGSMKVLNEIGLPNDEVEDGWLPFLDEHQENLVEGDEHIYLRLINHAGK
jgi:hypothetical protein